MKPSSRANADILTPLPMEAPLERRVERRIEPVTNSGAQTTFQSTACLPAALASVPLAPASESASPVVKLPAIKSMTGFAEARAESGGWRIRVSLRTVNHRFLDIRMRVPEGFEFLEPTVRQMVRGRLYRGHVDIAVHIDAVAHAAVEVHHDTAAAYLRAAQDLRQEFGLSGEPDVMALLRLPGVIGTRASAEPAARLHDNHDNGDNDDRLSRNVACCVEEALAQLGKMRETEGSALALEMRTLTASIGEKTAQLDSLIAQKHPAYALLLKERIEALIAGPVDPARVAQEAAVLAERADVTEELMRLRAHMAQFDKLVSDAGEAGKKLDFLLQEMHREANTLLSKTPALGVDGLTVTELGLQIKAEIEKLREQVQNVE